LSNSPRFAGEGQTAIGHYSAADPFHGDRSLRRPRLEIAHSQHAILDKKTDQFIR
jgi:hypothetical protein